MLGTSTALTTARSSTSHMSAILRLFDSVTGRSLRSTRASGWMPIERRAATECCVGFVFCSPDAPMNGTSETCTKNTFRRPSSWRIWRADSMNGCDSMSPTVPPISVMITSGARALGRLQPHAPLDLVGDVRDDLHGVAEVLAATLLGDDRRVDLAGGDVRRLAELDVEEALVVADVEVGLGAVVGDEDLAVLERVHRARIDVQVGVELLHDDAESARSEEVAQAGGRESLAQRGNDTTGHEDVLSNDGTRIDHHGVSAYPSFLSDRSRVRDNTPDRDRMAHIHVIAAPGCDYAQKNAIVLDPTSTVRLRGPLPRAPACAASSSSRAWASAASESASPTAAAPSRPSRSSPCTAAGRCSP